MTRPSTPPKLRRWTSTKLRPINLTLSQHRCQPCDGRGFLENQEGFTITAGLPCPICDGTGRRA